MKLSVLIPAYNEKETVAQVIHLVKAVKMEKEILVVDDGSTDGTREVLKDYDHDPEVQVFYHPRNLGKGSAIRTALDHVQGDLVIIQDADLELDPQDYPRLIKPIQRGETEIVYGSRYLSKENEFPSFKLRMGVSILNWMVRMLYGVRITDEATCYKLFRTHILKSIPLKCKGFEFCPEVTARVLKRRHRIVEVPISYKYRSAGEGKKLKIFREGLKALWTLLKYRIVD